MRLGVADERTAEPPKKYRPNHKDADGDGALPFSRQSRTRSIFCPGELCAECGLEKEVLFYLAGRHFDRVVLEQTPFGNTCHTFVELRAGPIGIEAERRGRGTPRGANEPFARVFVSGVGANNRFRCFGFELGDPGVDLAGALKISLGHDTPQF